MVPRKPIIGVMGSHEREWNEYASIAGKLIALFGYHLLTGAGSGVMTAVARAFTSAEDREGLSIGVVPTLDYKGGYLSTDQYPNPYIEIPILTPLDNRAQSDAMPFSRNQVNVMTSHALIILPGDHGTQNEAALALKYRKTAIYFGPEEAFKNFPEGVTRVDTYDEVCEFLEQVRGRIRTGEDK